MSMWQFLEAILMMTNALAILNEDRFLVPRFSFLWVKLLTFAHLGLSIVSWESATGSFEYYNRRFEAHIRLILNRKFDLGRT